MNTGASVWNSSVRWTPSRATEANSAVSPTAIPTRPEMAIRTRADLDASENVPSCPLSQVVSPSMTVARLVFARFTAGAP